MKLGFSLLALSTFLLGSASAQEYYGDFINNSLPGVPGSEIAYWKIANGKGGNNLTLINYINHGSDGNRLVPSNLKRAVVIIHGLDQDPGTYMANMLSALSQVPSPQSSEVNTDSVAIVAPFFANGDNKYTGYPWIDGLKANQGSITNALVWKGSQWAGGSYNQYPWQQTNTSSFAVLDQIITYFDNKTMFPNINQIVIAGHSLGGQATQRYAAIGAPSSTTPVSYWVANPNSMVWMSTDRPLSTASCPTYDNYREGYTNFTQYPMTYATSLVAAGRSAVLANFQSKAINWARGTLDLGDDSSTCAPYTTGANRNERFFNFIKSFPVSCPDPAGRNCDTVDFINAGHDGGAMMASAAGQARLFLDNWSGNGSRAYDFGYPRQQTGDDPYPNPALNTSSATVNNNTYAGNMTYWGCWSDQSSPSLSNMTYQSDANTIELCTATCAQGNQTIAGLEYGTQCFCGNSLGYLATEVIDSSCATNCSGNSSEICGGASRLSLFSNGQPAVSAAPGTPETINTSFYDIGCWTEATSGRALTGASTSGSFMTLEYCGSFCAGFKYFGTEYADECYCGNSLNAGSVQTSDSDCSMICAADSTEFCGAGNRLNMYQNTSYVTSTASSTTSTATSTSTTSASTSTATGPSCPASNNTVVTSYGQNFTIECGIDHSGGDLTSLTVSSFQGCIDTCSQNSQCVDVSLSGTACYLKSSVGSAVNNGVWGARLLTSSSTSSSSSASASITIASSISSSSSSSTTGTVSSSVASTSTSTSTSASATSTPLSCPNSNGTTVTSNGVQFYIECGIDHQGGDLTSLSVSSFQGCVDACATNSQCVDVALSGSACYLKSTLGAAVSNGVWGAKVIASSSSTLSASSSSSITASSASTSVSAPTTASSSGTSTSSSASASATAVSCPGSNSTTYIASTGQSFLIECGIDHYAGDMGSLSVSSFADCINACATTTGCVDVSLSGSACYMKSSVGAPVYNGVYGARLITSSSASSSSSASGSSSSASTSPSPPTSSSASTSSITSSTISSSFPSSTPSTTSPTTTSSPSTTSTVTPTPTLACPSSNNTLYQPPSSNQTFLIECSLDHPGGDESMLYVSSFAACIAACDSTTGCVDVSLSGAACYLKSTLEPANSQAGILGAKVVDTSTMALTTVTTSGYAVTMVASATSSGSSSSSVAAAASSSAAVVTAAASST